MRRCAALRVGPAPSLVGRGGVRFAQQLPAAGSAGNFPAPYSLRPRRYFGQRGLRPTCSFNLHHIFSLQRSYPIILCVYRGASVIMRRCAALRTGPAPSLVGGRRPVRSTASRQRPALFARADILIKGACVEHLHKIFVIFFRCKGHIRSFYVSIGAHRS